MIFVHVHRVTCTVHVDVLDPEAFDKCSRFGIKHPGPSWADSRRASDMSLSLLSSSLLQTATNPHRHHLRIAIVKLYDEGMIHEVIRGRPLFGLPPHTLSDEVDKLLTELADRKNRRILINDALQ